MGIKKEEKIERSADINIIKRLYPYIKKQALVFVTCLFLIGAITGIDLLVPYLTKVAIDQSIGAFDSPIVKVDGRFVKLGLDEELGDREVYRLEKDGDGIYLVSNEYRKILDFKEYLDLRANDKSQLKKIAVIMFTLFIVNFIFNFANVYLLNFASQKIIYVLRSDLYSHILKLSLSFFDKNPVGRLVTRVTSDMDNISKLFTDVLISVIKDIFLIVGTVIVMLTLNWRLGLVAMISLPLVIFISFVFRHYARIIQREVKVKLAKINAYLAESINGMKVIQIFNREDLTIKEFDEQNVDYFNSSIDETRVYALFRPGIHLMSGISLGFILLYGGFSSLEGSLEIGVLVAFFQYINHLFRPISSLAEKFNIFQSSMASCERVFILMDEDIEILNNKKTISPYDTRGEIVLENVFFSYIPGEPVIKGINLDINPGDTVALVGATGSGKTTITSLISRLYDIDSGSIKLDGVDIRDMDKHELRRRIAVVLQDVFLFSGDIKGNINLNNNEIGFDRVLEASEYVNAHKFVKKLPKKYDHEVRERGATFSSGEKQLISFARALAFNPDILILDEATSSIDTETEALIQDAIEKLIKDRTTIIVAHRLSTIKHADKIVVLHKGEIKEVGKHDELLRKKGMYYDLYKLQVEAL
ncbi:ABC transporter ATP-binding protein [Thiospirochaeta perfilievii]|uniref:ABC transporter ATP-binding protein n=1 Tax=Thiospirochaeta perfilievii TaxID=252967 RepID=A0A5C1QE46_9SPIO|nr:ABC transporter ATP-binding protein [Thiospirochaeta perfilievii]QEN04926.1 ABC transporter ATP-binding protein [Thiospirochaeta perfilievii]